MTFKPTFVLHYWELETR